VTTDVAVLASNDDDDDVTTAADDDVNDGCNKRRFLLATVGCTMDGLILGLLLALSA